jgi:hypothetical protein
VTVSENNVTIESSNDTGSAEYKLFNTVLSIYVSILSHC